MLFSRVKFDRARQDYRERWALLDKQLYEVCRRYPRHEDLGTVNAKLWLIGRSFATGIERQIKSDGSQGGSMGQLAQCLISNASELDQILSQLAVVQEPLAPDKLEAIASAHGRIMKIVAKVVRKNRSPRSFVSKYLHFHCPAVPIYDSWAVEKLRALYRWQSSFQVFKLPLGADEEYCWHLMRFWQLYEDAKKVRGKATSRMLDQYLLSDGEGER